ncbi:glucose-6-phosphate dehydrogenase [Sphingomonas xinjiangensis]|uniref:Glucose-6-phosphate 1-dehydrogenase n=1 Tax=Sphingomonas xinjiangensis TaxID=643568 RepID=A0A840Y8N5_9SPHN|nr:glucose-6-phosphate dehydrogenase [Sphingomonas xinjiangensis]MBB5709214.1 glucose-6-phosphate 1-dehydrogenase [Sphingomonas xinjiangensis]
MSDAPRAPAATLVIFGAMGDLAKRLLVPAIVNLVEAGIIDDATTILGVSHHDADDAALRGALDEFVEDKQGWKRLRDRITYMKGDFEEAATFTTLAERVKGNAVFYLATAPAFFGPVADALAKAGLMREDDGFRRLVIEKPFGTDLPSAQALNARLLAKVEEQQIYRIDHFLGKETVQNIMVARFGNALLEAVWNSRYIDHVQITAAEAVTVGTRGKFYDATGALRDMVPNHLFQLLALVGMEPPNSFDADAVRTEKAKVLAAARPVQPDQAVRGRYAAGTVGDKTVPAYVDEADVGENSNTETYAALKVEVDSWRWSGVPFYLRTGKGLKARDTEIVVQFRDVPIALFRDNGAAAPMMPNRLTLQLQPDEGMSFEFVAKKPGPVMETAPVSMDFRYADRFDVGHQTGYETLLYDVLTGDQTLFQRADQIEGGWRVIQPLLDAWASGAPDDYPAGSSGPKSANASIARDGRQWNEIA